MRRQLLAVAAATVLLAGCRDAAPPSATGGGTTNTPATTTTPKAKRTYTREEFRQLAIGLTGDELIARVGRPESTTDRGRLVFWYYHGLTTDPITGKPDRNISVVFEGGVVESVNY